ncbi:GNAT family N-acetyltransferase [Halobacillus mangrovi]|uniref:GNAT family N-acetyltransferase n=1 Tax=Halobacillus mangrovi TaxID=402384 RepID=UPI003D9722AE
MDLNTERLWIRKFKPTDWRAVYSYTSDREVMRFLPEGVHTEKDSKAFVNQNCDGVAKHFPVITLENNQLIGHMTFHKYFGDHTYEIGWVFHRDHHNKGYASEAAQALLKYGFETIQLHRIIATCQPENYSSHRVMEKIGMRKEGFFKKCIPMEEGWWDEFYYAILEEEYST